MRWDNLFSDLESQLEYGLNAEEDELEAEEERLRLGRLGLRDRLIALTAVADRGANFSVSLLLAGGLVVSLRVTTIAKDWLAGDLDAPGARHSSAVIPLSAIHGVSLTRRQVRHSLQPRAVDGAAGSLTDRLGLAFLLRDLCRRRTAVEAVLPSETLFGTIDRVGRDHFDMAVHEPTTPRRESDVRSFRIVAFNAVALIRV
ncbi:hypothetical protein [Agreia sp. COWG]|uniref:hypothetical protein n=1 Tax=Agreia sp. COWG TaxID=2773266 RepID=UPI0019251A03|nr:hypothetical protein [Agreia sp. COWG]CAD5993610.1 conserved protein of unknown function [Agreia sp. COWG]